MAQMGTSLPSQTPLWTVLTGDDMLLVLLFTLLSTGSGSLLSPLPSPHRCAPSGCGEQVLRPSGDQASRPPLLRWLLF